MKKIIIALSLSLFTITALFAQKEKGNRNDDYEKQKNNSNCTIKQSIKITSATFDLLESYRKLLNPSGLCKGSNGTPTSFGIMDAALFGNNGVTGKVTFSSFFEGADGMRTIWSDKASDFAYYGVCAPPTIQFPNPPIAANAVFASKFVTVKNYAANAANRDYVTATGVATANISSFDCIKLEEDYGFAASSDNGNFLSVFSSKGIVVLVTMKDGTKSWCYLINNYENGGTVKWKE